MTCCQVTGCYVNDDQLLKFPNNDVPAYVGAAAAQKIAAQPLSCSCPSYGSCYKDMHIALELNLASLTC